MFDLRGQVAIVTGAAQGNGRAIALGLAAAGAKVVCCDIQGDATTLVVETIRSSGGEAAAATLDVTNEQQCLAAAELAEWTFGPTSVLVNNAGVIRRTAADADAFPADWSTTMAVNATGAIQMVRAVVPQLRKTRGRIVNIASIMSVSAGPGLVAYAASKGAILQMTKALAHELAPDGVRVNAIAPGVIETPMTEATRSNPEAIGRFMAHTPIARPGKPDELVGPVIFLASTASSYVTGVLLPVDGGYLAA